MFSQIHSIQKSNGSYKDLKRSKIEQCLYYLIKDVYIYIYIYILLFQDTFFGERVDATFCPSFYHVLIIYSIAVSEQ